MLAKKVTCTIVEKIWVTPTVMHIRFEPSKKFTYTPGQFLSLLVPQKNGGKPVRRAYSFASAPDSKDYELCVKHMKGGIGSGYLASLRPGESFEATAPYGDFVYEPKHGHSACFIATGTGIAPFRSVIRSKEFRENPPEKTMLIFGARTEDEIIYPGEFEKLGVETILAVSKPGLSWNGFTGRVTDYLKTLPTDWGWHTTDFYLCGNGDMVADVRKILRGGHGVAPERIFQEVYFIPNEKSLDPFSQLKQAA